MKTSPFLLTVILLANVAHADDIATIKAVGPGAAGAAEARVASEALTKGGAKNLLPILKSFKGSSALASNWLRSTFEAIADAETKTGAAIPKDDLLTFVKTTSESPEARRLAYEWLLKRSPQLADQLIPNMLLDPGPDFRRDAVERLLKEAGDAKNDAATAVYRKALQGAVHEDHVKKIAKALRDAGDEVNIQQHFGFLSSWKIVGPFDNKDKKGFPIAYPPEESLDLQAEYDGQLGKVKWEPIATEDDYGMVDIARQIENYKGSLMYATTTYTSSKDQQVELRLGTPNAWKLWVNGELVFEREEYHRSTKMDQYKIPVSLEAGDNVVTLKICQNEQEDSWAQSYQFQIRVCDSTGSAIPSSNKTARRETAQGASK
jgi:hypothetical protein